MMDRRRFTASVAASTLMAPGAFAAAPVYDLVIKNGRVIDPSRKFDGVRDIGIAHGHIISVAQNIKTAGAKVYDAAGKLVTPGLIDIHTHATGEKDGPQIMLADGVVAWIDAGSKGADGIDLAVAAAKASPTLGKVLINIGRLGTAPDGDTLDLSRADVAACKDGIARNRDTVVGVKARLSKEIAGENDFEALKRAEEAAGPLPVMIHMGDTVTPLGKLLDLMKAGDIVSHVYAPPPNAIISDDGKLIPEVIAARKRGVLFDIGNGRLGHVRWDVAEKALAQGFPPDTYSTDWTLAGHKLGTVVMPVIMSNMLSLGIPLNNVIVAVTINAARAFPAFRALGTLSVGARADIAVLELQQGSFEFVDTFNNKRPGTQKLICRASVLGGALHETA